MTAVEVHAVVEGPAEAPVLLLSNSLGSDLSMWDPQVPALTERFRVVRYDTRGHGRSPSGPGDATIDDLADDVVALLDRLGVARAHVAGVSIGGMTGLRLAVREPQRVLTLAVLCSSAHTGNAASWADRARTVRAEGTGAIAEPVVSRWLTPPYAAAHPDLVARLQAMVAAADDEGYAGCCAAIERMDQRADLHRITAPTLVVSGAEDQAVPPEHQQLIADGVPGARLLSLSPAAHLANLEQPEQVSRALIAHATGGTP
ncbi:MULTISPECIES: 3-oxoadipate enol-lactonase [unclassified Modestobacter]|uniref:3-oxoadipate enol-lactonase n=1 Tax=unclassified Modestobacter TaxID=2643866 RepID=UPI0022AA6756|nr:MULTISPECIES: 3-oxoadipate enol-lactonase [unclassified Modestobacter]MCZ2823447.1 3-oxoadipate enol-lactonase [Modestobacter sp. VKM Ac-2981]MCZ2851692.1 3-oxoadipate enol-lactonase [Modestobacter sp. VKM Ac-2982]